MLAQKLSQLLLPPTVALWLSLSSPTTISQQPIDILQVIQVFGRLALPTCYGRMAQPGASCQMTRDDLRQKLGLDNDDDNNDSLTAPAFAQKLDALNFAWPLKPYGVADSSSLAKTALMNKGAETRLYMQELQAAGLYDPRNPTGPLPTSLRPQLNARLQQVPIESSTAERVFAALLRSAANNNNNNNHSEKLTTAQLDRIFKEKNAMDYYEFIGLLGGADAVTWR